MGRRNFYHISTGTDFAIKELFDLTVEALGVELEEDVEVRPRGADDVATILIDPSKTVEDFGWRAQTPLSEGIQNAVDWYGTYGIEQTYTHLKQADEKS